MSHAAELGIKHIWTTEHDTRMGKKQTDIPVFTFPEDKLFTVLENGAKAGFLENDDNSGSYAFEKTENKEISEYVKLKLGTAQNKE